MLWRAPGGRGFPQQLRRRTGRADRRKAVRQRIVAIEAGGQAWNVTRRHEPIERLSRARRGIGAPPQGGDIVLDGAEIPQGSVQHG